MTPLRREAPAFDRLPADERAERAGAAAPGRERAERSGAPRQRLAPERSERAERMGAAPLETDPIEPAGELMSPFEEDELDVPTFLRRGGQAEEKRTRRAGLSAALGGLRQRPARSRWAG